MVEGLTIMLEEFLGPCYTHKQCQIATVLVLAFNDGYTTTTCGCSSPSICLKVGGQLRSSTRNLPMCGCGVLERSRESRIERCLHDDSILIWASFFCNLPGGYFKIWFPCFWNTPDHWKLDKWLSGWGGCGLEEESWWLADTLIFWGWWEVGSSEVSSSFSWGGSRKWRGRK